MTERMPPERFVELGRAIYGRQPDGYGWQSEMHRQSGVPLRTVQAFAAGTNPVPWLVADLMRKLVDCTTPIYDAP